MPTIDLDLTGDDAWPDLVTRREVIQLPVAAVWRLAALEGGMGSGAASLALRLDIDNHRVVVAQTSLAAWIAATCALRGRFPDAFRGTPLEGPP
ncbi:MAG: hypothetical protein ACRD0W_05780 [Acidimicrobiales bacterium]